MRNHPVNANDCDIAARLKGSRCRRTACRADALKHLWRSFEQADNFLHPLFMEKKQFACQRAPNMRIFFISFPQGDRCFSLNFRRFACNRRRRIRPQCSRHGERNCMHAPQRHKFLRACPSQLGMEFSDGAGKDFPHAR
jgi:hypothetical protein